MIRQLLTESVALATLGGIVGAGVAMGLLRVLSQQLSALPIVMPHLRQVTITSRVLGFNAAVCIVVAGLFSLAPVLAASRMDLQNALRSGRSPSAARRSARLFSFLI